MNFGNFGKYNFSDDYHVIGYDDLSTANTISVMIIIQVSYDQGDTNRYIRKKHTHTRLSISLGDSKNNTSKRHGVHPITFFPVLDRL